MDAKKLLYNMVYVPVMRRWGDDEHGHSYILGVFEDLEQAKAIAEQEREDRAGKYEWVMMAYPMNKGVTTPVSRKIYRVAKSAEMNCLLDSERSEVLSDEAKFSEYYKKASKATLLSDHENATKNAEYWAETAVKLTKKLNGTLDE